MTSRLSTAMLDWVCMLFQDVTLPVLLNACGKLKPTKLLQKKPRYQAVFKNPKKLWDISEDFFLELEEFTCSTYKPRGSHLTVDDLRYELVLIKCCGKDNQLGLNLKKSTELPFFPPPRACLREHLKRVNYEEDIWKRARISKPIIPLPTGNNGWILVNKVIEPK